MGGVSFIVFFFLRIGSFSFDFPFKLLQRTVGFRVGKLWLGKQVFPPPVDQLASA